ncbi:MAG TPA: hypothetical protein DEA75_11765, partial [Rhodobacteraceae bacterium]|nr:hypothetical protein [Paracoccaceae bacterium]
MWVISGGRCVHNNDVKPDRQHPVPHDLLIPGGVGIDTALKDPKLKTLIGDWHLHHPGGRLAAVCSGALLLANSGILDGKPAAT